MHTKCNLQLGDGRCTLNTPPSSQALLPAFDARGPPSDGAGVVVARILRLSVATSPDGRPSSSLQHCLFCTPTVLLGVIFAEATHQRNAAQWSHRHACVRVPTYSDLMVGG